MRRRAFIQAALATIGLGKAAGELVKQPTSTGSKADDFLESLAAPGWDAAAPRLGGHQEQGMYADFTGPNGLEIGDYVCVNTGREGQPLPRPEPFTSIRKRTDRDLAIQRALRGTVTDLRPFVYRVHLGAWW